VSGRYQRNSARRGHPFNAVPDLPCRDAGEDPDLWFPQPGNPGLPAVSLCRRKCPITAACLAWALDTGQNFGTWGGMTAGARASLSTRAERALIREGWDQLQQLTQDEDQAQAS
jgi:WhiB family transcriptional regulator, redox-sensing transcriptional regulator